MTRLLFLIAALVVIGVTAASMHAAWRAERPTGSVLAPAAMQAPPASVPIEAAAKTSTVASAVMADAGEALLALGALAAHALPDPARCLADTGRAVRERPIAVHRWVDANGITHFSDSPPSGANRQHRVIEVGGLPPIVVRARGHDVNLPHLLEQRAMADAQAIERVLREGLGVGGAPGFVLDIVFVKSPETYARFVPTPALAGSAGAYSSRERTIYVRWQADEDLAFTILRHEITHALVHERVGSLPVAINEGLAGYFERIAVSGLGAQIVLRNAPAALRGATVSEDGADELVDLLAREPAAFYADGREVRYLHAFALVATLMSHAEGRAALAGVLAAQREDSCVPVDVPRGLDAGYPGGLAALAVAWSRWLRDPPATVHAY